MLKQEKIESFFKFINEREQIRLRKESGMPAPLTEDKILQDYKFTNVRRFHDRTTAELRKTHYEFNREADHKEILMNCALFRYFGTYEFANDVGWQNFEDFDFYGIKDTASTRLSLGMRVFTGAYVITNQGLSAPKEEVVVDHFLRDLHANAEDIVEVARKTKSWEKVAERMSSIKGFGGSGFMTKEILLDTMMTDFWDDNDFETFDGYRMTYPDDYTTWTPIGPGGSRGISRLRGNEEPESVKIKNEIALEDILVLTKLHPTFWDISQGKLYPTDIQFQLCEFDKYERVRLGQGRPRSRYKSR